MTVTLPEDVALATAAEVVAVVEAEVEVEAVFPEP